MKLLPFIFSGVILMMNIATAATEQVVSYHSAPVNGLEIFYREAGPKDAPAILLLHGLPSSSRMYQLDLFYDYQNNVKSYPKWQQWLRDHQPPLLVLWGRYDTSFTVAGGEAYHRDDPRAEVHLLDAGHFALDLKSQEIIQLMVDFLKNAL
jgi:pimeloyl-ACP methyl ester carboxylesterase